MPAFPRTVGTDAVPRSLLRGLLSFGSARWPRGQSCRHCQDVLSFSSGLPTRKGPCSMPKKGAWLDNSVLLRRKDNLCEVGACLGVRAHPDSAACVCVRLDKPH